jgi:hypothetical protein
VKVRIEQYEQYDMNTLLIAADAPAAEPAIVEIIESVDSTTRQRSRLGLIPATPVLRQSIHLEPEEFTITPQKKCGAQPREPRLVPSSE